MMYIDPKDQECVTYDTVYDAAWAERRALRLQYFDIGKKIEALDAFIATYERLKPQPEKSEQQCTCTPASSHQEGGAIWATSGAVDPCCPIHRRLAMLQNGHVSITTT